MAIKLTEFYSVQKPEKSFNLLYLDQDEFLISSLSCRLTSPEYQTETGKLHLCTRGVVFQPSNSKLPLLRFKLSNADFRYTFGSPERQYASSSYLSPKSNTARSTASSLDSPTSTLIISVTRFDVIHRTPCSPRFSKPSANAFSFEISTVEMPRVSAELEMIASGEEEDTVAELIYSVRYREFTTVMLTESEDFDRNELLLHHKTTRLLVEGKQLGAFVLTQSSLHFYPLINAKPSEQIHLVFKAIQFAVKCEYLQEQVGLQIYRYSSPWPVEFIYETQDKRDNIYSFLQNRVKFHDPEEALPHMTDLWCRGHLSTFSYLTYINHISGRSVLDLSQYPVFPWVLSHYHGDTLDLHDSRNYRDLSKPVGALNSERLERLQVGCK